MKNLEIILISIVLSVIFVYIFIPNEDTTEKVDYHLIINGDSIKLKDLNNNVIYKDTFNFSNPDKMGKAILEDNL